MRFAMVVAVAVAMVGCGQEAAGPDAGVPVADAGLAPLPDTRVGKACKTNEDCSGVAGLYCAPAGVCTKGCAIHADCGCGGGTTNGDLDARKCGAACVAVSSSASACFRLCDFSSECAGGFVCSPSASKFTYCYFPD